MTNTWASGTAKALRIMSVMLSIARDMAELAPGDAQRILHEPAGGKSRPATGWKPLGRGWRAEA